MRKTLHDYVIEKYGSLSDKIVPDYILGMIVYYAKLTNRAPRLGDFVPCDEDGNVLEKPDIHSLDHSTAVAMHNEYQAAHDRVIFAGDWEVVKGSNSNHTRIYCKQLHTTIDFELSGVSVIRTDSIGFVLERGVVDRIEDLPREIEFKEGVI